jgi:hypothetical protein
MRKAVAIPYIIALIIGIVVVAVLAYWLISSGGKGSDVGKEAECTARKTEFCATQLSEKREIVKECDSTWSDDQKVCSYCKAIIPGWNGKSAGITCT